MQSIIEIARQIRRRLLLWSLLGWILLGTILSALSYFDYLRIAEKQVLARLNAIAVTLSTQLSAERHRRILQKYRQKDAIATSTQDKDYQVIHQMLRQVQLKNDIKTPIYTMIRRKGASTSERKGAFFFGVTSAKKPYFRHPYTPPKALFEQYEKGGQMRPYGDKHGQWLSAFVPIADSKGQVAVVQVDMKFGQFRKRARARLLQHILVSIGIIVVVWLILFRLVWNTTHSLVFHHEKQRRNMQFQEGVLLDNQALQETVGAYAGIVDHLADGILVTDTEGVVIHMNSAFFDLFGEDVGGMLGSSFKESCPKDLKELLHEASLHEDQLVHGVVTLGEVTTEAAATSMFQETQGDNPQQNIFVGLLLTVRMPRR